MSGGLMHLIAIGAQDRMLMSERSLIRSEKYLTLNRPRRKEKWYIKVWKKIKRLFMSPSARRREHDMEKFREEAFL